MTRERVCFLISKVHFINSIETEKLTHRHKHRHAMPVIYPKQYIFIAILLECHSEQKFSQNFNTQL